MDEPTPQPSSRAPVLLPTLVDGAFDYLVPAGTQAGAIVETKLAGRALVGVVWGTKGAASYASFQGERTSPAAPLEKHIPLSKLKPITRVIDSLPPLSQPFRDWLDWISDFTLAPKGAVLSLCGLSHAAVQPKKPQAVQQFTIALPTLTADQQAVADVLCAAVAEPAVGRARSAEALPQRGRVGVGADDGERSPHITMPLLQTRDFARKLRTEMTDAEHELWYHLRQEGLGVKFRRQYPIGTYVADFACLNPKLIIELDGGQHNAAEALAHDAKRSAFLEAQGFKVIRFWNNDVLQNMAGVWDRVVEAIAMLASPPRAMLASPPPQPSPSGGGPLALRASAPVFKAPQPILLDGVTGSGKTEVYFHAIAAAITGVSSTPSGEEALRSVSEPRSGGGLGVIPPSSALAHQQQILVLLPEIALTHQWLERFEKTFGAKPVMWHSRMTPVAKARAWQAIARGEVQVVVGARSALFLPFVNLALIIVDEEHDPSYKQEDGVLYHARDMAVVRAHFERVPIVLASATPSLETMENVREGKYRALTLTSRYGAAGLPTVRLVDMRLNPPERGDFISPVVKHAMLETLARGEQVLFFLNRRGYAPLLLCRTCGHRFQCGDCSAWLVVHGKKGAGGWGLGASKKETTHYSLADSSKKEGVRSPAPSPQPPASHLSCHHCGHREPMPKACPSCAADAEQLAACGPGVERIAEEVRGMFGNGTGGAASVPSPSGGRSGWGLVTASALEQNMETRKGHPLEKTLQHAHELHQQMTEAEKRLWQKLRGESLNVKFRKQHPIGNYIADFVSFAPKLVIELDGGQHNTLEAAAYDHARTAFLNAQGFNVIRFWNNEVMENIEGVVTKIMEAMSLASPHPNLPPEGEGTPAAPCVPEYSAPRITLLSSDESIPPETWAAIEAGEVDILVGTQMVAKGHHFPRLTLVVVVDADVGLDGADLRAGERSFQLLHQLGGRAGRGELAGNVLVQTYAPEHPVMKALVAHDRNRLMALEAKERKAGGWPPFGQLAAILLDGVDEAKVRAAGQMLARTAPEDARLKVLGPAPAPLSKLRGQYRYRLLVKATPGIHLQRTLRAWLHGQKFSGVRIKVDVNPYYFM